jgi:hypothetical protein
MADAPRSAIDNSIDIHRIAANACLSQLPALSVPSELAWFRPGDLSGLGLTRFARALLSATGRL